MQIVGFLMHWLIIMIITNSLSPYVPIQSRTISGLSIIIRNFIVDNYVGESGAEGDEFLKYC